MKLFSHLCVPALVACLTHLAFGAYTPEQLGVAIQVATKKIQDADNYVNNQNAFTADLDTKKIIANSGAIQTTLTGINAKLGGTKVPATADPAVDVPANEFITAYGTYLTDLTNQATKFLLPSDKTKIKTATDNLTTTFLTLFNNIIALFNGNADAVALGEQVVGVKANQAAFDTAYTVAGV